MTNDLSTLSGALLEMKDQLIYELGQKGVTATYDSSTGLLGLIGEISNIQTGGGSCYHIEFSEASYVAVGGSATLEVYLQSNYAPLANATVTVTGSDSSLYTGITDSNGIAEVTVSVSSDTTFTCSYSNVTDTCEVIAESYIYSNDMTTDDGKWIKSSTSGMTVSYGSNGCTVTGSTTADRYYYLNTYSTNPIVLPTNYVVECDITAYVLGAYSNSTEFFVGNAKVLMENSEFQLRAMDNNDNITRMSIPSLPIHMRFEKNGSTISVYVNGTLLGTRSTNNSYARIGYKTYNQRSITAKNITIAEL